MDEDEWRAFVTHGTRTGKLGVVRADGRPLVVPIWFVLEDDGVIRFQTSLDSAKVRALQHEPRVCLTIDDETPPFAFVLIEATAKVTATTPDDRAGEKGDGEVCARGPSVWGALPGRASRRRDRPPQCRRRRVRRRAPHRPRDRRARPQPLNRSQTGEGAVLFVQFNSGAGRRR